MINFKKILSPSYFKCLTITLFLVSILLFFLFKDFIFSINSTYFSSDLKSLKTYYSILYHVRYDESLFRTTALNYPYGEMLFFTDSQAPLANSIKLFSHYLFDISDYTVAIINSVLLLSFVLTSVFIFMIFNELKVNLWYASYVSVALTFLSPQLANLTEHFSLSYSFIIPLAILLLMLFQRKPAFYKSFAIALLTFWSAGIHFYYFAFLLLLQVFVWGDRIIIQKQGIRKGSLNLIHFFIQLPLPYAALQLIIFLNDTVSDRTTHPFAILEHKTHLTTVFLPFHAGSIGLVAILGMLCFMVFWIRKMIQSRFKSPFYFTNYLQLNVLFWASFVALLYSLGVPYVWGLEGILNYVGFLRQIRDIGRLSWLFFYTINILTFYVLWSWKPEHRFKTWLIVLALCAVGGDAFLNVRTIQPSFTKQLLTKTSENEWLSKINSENYQAIITFPYFHEGSENIWYLANREAILSTFTTSLSTGLPAMTSMYFRTSIRQTLDNLQVSLEPYRNLNFISKCHSKKPFLLLVAKSDSSSNRLEALCRKKLYEFKRFTLYELPYFRLKTMTDLLYEETLKEMNTSRLYKHKNVYSTDSLQNFVYNDFYGNLSNNAYMGVDAFEGSMKNANVFFRGSLPNIDTTKKYVVSFWLGEIQRDLCSRTFLKIRLLDKNKQCYQSETVSMFKYYQTLDKNWGLIEYKFKFKHPDDILELKAQNQEMLNEKLYIDQLLIRPVTTTIFIKLPEYIGKNNRYFKIE